MHVTSKTKDVCSTLIDFDLIDGKVYNVVFKGGCNGNLKAISKLVDGMTVGKITETLAGNTCGNSYTSCADQLARAIEAAEEA